MTKIKDLATVSVDTAFRMFPVDCERYELAHRLGDWLIEFDAIDLEAAGPMPDNYAVCEWYSSVQENLLRGILAYRRCCEAGFPRSLPAIVEDRARRVEATVSGLRHSRRENEARFCYSSIEVQNRVLWGCILGEMFNTRGFIVPEAKTLASAVRWERFYCLWHDVNKSFLDMELQS